MKKHFISIMLAATCVLVSAVWYSCTKDDSAADAKGSIYGIVTTTGEPLKGINVSLYKDASVLLSTVTYDDGHYEFSDLTPEEYTLKVNTEGYQLHYASVLVEANRQARMDIQLRTRSSDNGVIVLQTDGIMVQQYDLSSGIDWFGAEDLCSSSQIGGYSDWRLPTYGEMEAIYNKKNIIGNFSNAWYWTKATAGYAYYACNFSDGEIKSFGFDRSYRVRAVRSL